jgi:uncharacterized protein YbaP (TraB family)
MKPGRSRLLRAAALLAALLCSTGAHAQKAGGAHILLQSVTQGDSTVYLLGSVHVAKPDIYPLNDYIEKAFADSSRLVVEVDLRRLDQSALQKKLMELGTLAEGKTLRDALQEETLRSLEAKLAELGVSERSFERFKPWVVYLALAELDLARLGYQAENGVDLYFLKRAGDREVVELESAENQISLLAGFSGPEQGELLSEYLMQSPAMEREIASLFEAWLAGDDRRIAEIVEAEFSTTSAARRVGEVLLRTRDAAMTARIKDLLCLPGASFVVVGAAHLCGEGGIVDLLRRDGYEVKDRRGE